MTRQTPTTAVLVKVRRFSLVGFLLVGQFSLCGSCSLFVFEPGYELPDADSYDPVAIDADWYLLGC